MPKTTEARRRANAKYDAVNTTQFRFKFNNKTDADIIKKLNDVPNRTGYIKDLVREDIKAAASESDSSES